MYGLWFMQSNPSFFVDEEVYKKNRCWNSCWFGKVAVTSQGNVLPCVFARNQVAGNIKHQSLSEIINGETMLSYWELTKDKVEACKDCEYRYVCQDCRPWAYGFTGKLTAKSPRCTYNPYTGVWANAKEKLSQVGECIGKSNNRRL
jgi:radical SAM protein with 4Fe4S-binding SPASM domain